MSNPMPPYVNNPMQPPMQQPMQQPMRQKLVKTPQQLRDLSIISFVLSVCSLVATNLVGIGLGVLAMILSFQAERNTYRKLAFILSIAGIAVSFLMLLFTILGGTLRDPRFAFWMTELFTGNWTFPSLGI